MSFRFDPTINVGNIIALLIMLGGLMAIWVKIETSLAVYETKITSMENNINEIKQELVWMRRNNAYFYRHEDSFRFEDTSEKL